MSPTTQQISTAAEVLGKISLNDYQFAKPDAGMAIAWAETFAIHKLERSDLLRAVTVLFADDSRPRDRILPADVIVRARAIRRERAEREKSGQPTEPRELSPARKATLACALCDPNGFIDIGEVVARCDHRTDQQLTG